MNEYCSKVLKSVKKDLSKVKEKRGTSGNGDTSQVRQLTFWNSGAW